MNINQTTISSKLLEILYEFKTIDQLIEKIKEESRFS